MAYIMTSTTDMTIIFEKIYKINGVPTKCGINNAMNVIIWTFNFKILIYLPD